MQKLYPKAHKWILDRYSFGVCVKCGEKRQFPTDEPTYTRYDRMLIDNSGKSWFVFAPWLTGTVALKERK